MNHDARAEGAESGAAAVRLGAAAAEAAFQERSQTAVTKNVPMSHLSIEVGHFYMKDLERGEEAIREQFRKVAPWVHMAEAGAAALTGGKSTPRVSTCFLADDYFHHDTKPAEILGPLLRMAEEEGLRIDYIVREAGCAKKDGLELARLVERRLQAEPAPGTNGSRPPTEDSGWLCNGQRSPGAESREAMQQRDWKEPQEFGGGKHSIFMDVELWKDNEDLVDGRPVNQRLWSCPFLASVWQLLRLGLLRRFGEPVTAPEPWWDEHQSWPDDWVDMPIIAKLNKDAKPFSAYRAISIMPQTFLPIEDAVRLILDHVVIESDVMTATDKLAAAEKITLPAKISERITHIFLEGH